MLDKIESSLTTLNCAAVIDHSGRGGNAFFLTTFDTHPQVLCCPLLHYSYSYVLDSFSDQTELEVDTVRGFLKEKSYFRLLCKASKDNQELIYRMGADEFEIPHQKIREILDTFLNSRQTVTRKELILLPFIIYAIVFNKPLENYKYVLISDAVSLRHERLIDGFSGKAIECMIKDFPNCRLISIVRDLRAVFASPRHQFVNQLGNMYAIKPSNVFARLVSLCTMNFSPDKSCVYLYWLAYLAQSTKVIHSLRRQYSNYFVVVKNEDLNLKFKQTVESICERLDVEMDSKWLKGDFMPTIFGKPWQGTGAYNSRYQNVTHGLLKNDSDSQSKASAGPNQHVVQRWKSKLSAMEIRLIEALFSDEMDFMGYEHLYPKVKLTKLAYLKLIIKPFQGELPNVRWLFSGFQQSSKEGSNRLFYMISFIPFYFVSRFILYRLIFSKQLFDIKPDKILIPDWSKG